MSYSQFIHGKITGGRNYEIVAATADLAERRDELENIAQKYRFWGAQPPVANPIAVGVFHHQGQLLLVQAMQGALRNGQPAADVQGRHFTQHRYVFVPPESLKGLSGRLWLLLNWIMEETRGIPVFSQQERNLPPLSAPNITGQWYNPAEGLDKLERALTLEDKSGQPVLLSALAALVNQKRVVFDAAAVNNIYSEELLEGILLLLPAFCRTEVSVAAGALDEKICRSAQLMVKTNGSPAGPLASDLIWAKRANNEFFGDVNLQTLHSGYTNILQPILAEPNSRPILLRILDNLDSLNGASYSSPWQALSNGWLTTRLIPALPNPEERAKYWQSALKDLSPQSWETILPSIVDDVGLEIAWAELQKQCKSKPSAYAPLVFKLWQNFSESYVHYVLQQELPADTKLASALAENGLFTELGSKYHSDLFNLALVLLTLRANQNRKQAEELLDLILETRRFKQPGEQFSLRETLLPKNANRKTLITYFNSDIAPVLPTLSLETLAQSQAFQQLKTQAPEVSTLIERIASKPGQALRQLPDLANATTMSITERGRFYSAYVTHQQASYQSARPLLTDLVTQWIATYPPDERPPLAESLQALAQWLKREAPANIKGPLTENTGQFSFKDWDTLGQNLFDGPLGQVSFLDHVTVGLPETTMSQRWLLVIAENDTAKARFEASYTWHNLQTDGPAWLADAIAKLLGWQETNLSAMLPLLERLQNALNLPQASLFKLLQTLPRQGDDDLGMMLAAYLPQFVTGKTEALEELPMWQMLNAQAPKVASVYKVLAEGQKNPAIDMFNQLKLSAALSEAPEYAGAMAHWLQLCGKGTWIRGRLLETLLEQWQANPAAIDPILLSGLLQPELAEKYSVPDWLLLAKICWQPAYQGLWPLSGQPSLSARQQAQALSVAKTCIAAYTAPTQAETLLNACQNWGLSHDALAELISRIPQQACNFRLLQPYLYTNGTTITPNNHTNENLLALVMQLQTTDPVEQHQQQTIISRAIADQLKDNGGVPYLTSWYRICARQNLYKEALANATLDLASTHFSPLIERAHQLQRQNGLALSKVIVSALDSFWTEQKKKLS